MTKQYLGIERMFLLLTRHACVAVAIGLFMSTPATAAQPLGNFGGPLGVAPVKPAITGPGALAKLDGTITGLSVNKSAVQAGEKFMLTIQGSGRCAVRVLTTQSPTPMALLKDAPFPLTVQLSVLMSGNYELKAEPFGGKDALVNPDGRLCSGQAVAQLSVTPANATAPAVVGNTPAVGAGTVSALSVGGTQAALMPKLEVQDTLGVYQATIKLKATFTGSDGKPLAGKVMEFHVGGKSAGSAQTGADGVAVRVYVVPESLPAGANPIEVRSGNAVAKGNLGVLRAATQLTLAVDYPGNDAVVQQGHSVTLRGYLRPAASDDAVASRQVRITVDGKDVGTDKTNASGMFELKYPVALGAPKNLEVLASFEGDTHYLANVSKAVQIHTKPVPKRLPPSVTQGPGTHAVGANSLPPSVTQGPGIHAVGANSLPPALTVGPGIHATGLY
jgi:hypothetical protein